MIVLLTDYGLDGLYVGQLHAVIQEHSPGTPVIDLTHSLPRFNIRSTAYLLAAYTRALPAGSVTVCVCDPGVGSERQHAVVSVDGRFYVGPDNGQFDVLVQQARQSQKYLIDWQQAVSNSFHGRDVYAPIACMIQESGSLDKLQYRVSNDRVTQLQPDSAEVIYVDTFGNIITGMRAVRSGLAERLNVGEYTVQQASTFSDVAVGVCFWYENANGLLEIAANQASAADILGLKIGDAIIFPGKKTRTSEL